MVQGSGSKGSTALGLQAQSKVRIGYRVQGSELKRSSSRAARLLMEISCKMLQVLRKYLAFCILQRENAATRALVVCHYIEIRPEHVSKGLRWPSNRFVAANSLLFTKKGTA